MREHATLRLLDGRELSVEVEGDDLDQETILVHRAEGAQRPGGAFLVAIDAHLATASPHPAGTTDQALAEDRSRPY